MTTQVGKNVTFWQQIKSTIFGRDTYVTPSGQKICMKAGQGKVEVDDNGEVSIFNGHNVKAKGVDGVTDVFKLYDCTGSRNRGKKLNDAGDKFEMMDGDKASSAKSSDSSDSSNNSGGLLGKLGSLLGGGIFNTNVGTNNGTIENTLNAGGASDAGKASDSDSTPAADKSDDAAKTSTDSSDKADNSKSDSKPAPGGIFNTNVGTNNGTIKNTLNADGKSETSEEGGSSAKSSDKSGDKNPLEGFAELFKFLSEWWNKYQGQGQQ